MGLDMNVVTWTHNTVACWIFPPLQFVFLFSLTLSFPSLHSLFFVSSFLSLFFSPPFFGCQIAKTIECIGFSDFPCSLDQIKLSSLPYFYHLMDNIISELTGIYSTLWINDSSFICLHPGGFQLLSIIDKVTVKNFVCASVFISVSLTFSSLFPLSQSLVYICVFCGYKDFKQFG